MAKTNYCISPCIVANSNKCTHSKMLYIYAHRVIRAVAVIRGFTHSYIYILIITKFLFIIFIIYKNAIKILNLLAIYKHKTQGKFLNTQLIFFWFLFMLQISSCYCNIFWNSGLVITRHQPFWEGSNQNHAGFLWFTCECQSDEWFLWFTMWNNRE